MSWCSTDKELRGCLLGASGNGFFSHWKGLNAENDSLLWPTVGSCVSPPSCNFEGPSLSSGHCAEERAEVKSPSP